MTRRQAIKYAISLVTSIVALVIFISAQGPAFLPEPVPPGLYRVTQVHDGDTVAVDMNGREEKVRFIGIDTPETHKPGEPVHCFGPEATAFTRGQVEGKNVRLEADQLGDNRDRYDRLLRYVYLEDGKLLNQALISQGYAFAYTTFPFQKRPEFIQAHEEAKQAKRGLWAVCTPKDTGGRWQSNDLR